MDRITQDVLDSVRGQLDKIVMTMLAESQASVGDMGKLEAVLAKAMSSIRGEIVNAALAAGQRALTASAVWACPDCEQKMSRWGSYNRSIVTSQGAGKVRAERYLCRKCRAQVSPFLVQNGLIDTQYTLGAREEIAREAAECSFDRAAHRLQRLGIPISAANTEIVSDNLAEDRETEEEAVRAHLVLCGKDLNLPLHDDAPWRRAAPTVAAVVSVDGAMVRSNKVDAAGRGREWFEVRAAVLSLNESGAPKIYIGGVTDSDKLFETMQSQARQVFGHRDVVFVADGAAWIWDRARYRFPKAIQVLDIYHASEHVGSAARAMWGEGDPRTQGWVAGAITMLTQPAGVRQIMRTITNEMRKKTALDRAALATEFGYLWRNRRRMRYPDLLAKGLPIGSGIMESAIKQLCTQRLRGSGMMWTRDGAGRILRLRAACLSGSIHFTTKRLERTFKTRLEAYKQAA